jgi:osmotically-inducible protein OsmY
MPHRRSNRLAIVICTGAFAFSSLSLQGCITRCTTDACRADARISAAVRAQFNQHADLGGANEISVQTVDRVVYLHGLVSTPLVRETAESVAMSVDGVDRVVNEIGLDNNH